MPNQFKEATTTGYGGRIMKSAQGVLAGIVLFFASFGVLYWNEGRFDLSIIAKDAVPISANDAAPSKEAGPVALTGILTSDESLGDEWSMGEDNIQIAEGDYIALKRTVEMYAWVEEKKSETKKNTGGSETTETTYDYKTKWIPVKDAEKSKDFKYPEDHQNPEVVVEDVLHKVQNAQIGTYSIDMNTIELPDFKPLPLGDDSVMLPKKIERNIKFVGSEYLFLGFGTVEAPKVGDVRVSYTTVPNNSSVTAFGKINDGTLASFTDAKDHTLYRIFNGTKDEAVERLHTEYTTSLWIFRLVGFAMMWIGLMLLFEPLSTLLDVVPVFGSLSRGVVGVASFMVALILSVVTILVSMVLHNIVVLIIVLALAIGGTVGVLKYMKKNKKVINK